jgi:hypothetical protein
VVCEGITSAAQPWRWHNADNKCTTRDINRATASGEVHTTRVCARTTPGPKRQGLRSTVACSVCGCRRRAGTRRALVGTKVRHDCKARERARRRLQRHLQNDRLGSMTGSQATAGLCGGAMRDSGHHTNSELTRLGPSSARRPGPHQGEGCFSPRVLDTTARRRGDEQRNGLEQRKQGGAVHGFRGDITPVLQPRSWAFRRAR